MGACLSCMKKSGRVTVDAVADVGNIIGETATTIIEGTTGAIGDTVAAVTAATVAPQIRGVKYALFASLQPLLMRSLAIVPFVYAAQVAVVHWWPTTAWLGSWMPTTVAIGLACGALLVISGRP